MTGATLGSLLEFLLIAGLALTAVKLFATGLYKQYPVFFCYFIFRIPNSLLPRLVDVRSPLYFKLWTYSEIITLIFYVLLVVELYRLVLARYRGLQTVGRWAMYASVVVAATVSVGLSLIPKINEALPRTVSRIITFNVLVLSERGIDAALAIFIILILLFLSRYPIKLSWN